MKKTSDPDFDRFWETYPQRVGKLKAEQAYAKAKNRATADEILSGVARYVKHKPDWQAWAHPATWLNAGRWMDEYESPKAEYVEPDWLKQVKAAAESRRWKCPHVEHCSNRGACDTALFLGPERYPLKEPA